MRRAHLNGDRAVPHLNSQLLARLHLLRSGNYRLIALAAHNGVATRNSKQGAERVQAQGLTAQAFRAQGEQVADARVQHLGQVIKLLAALVEDVLRAGALQVIGGAFKPFFQPLQFLIQNGGEYLLLLVQLGLQIGDIGNGLCRRCGGRGGAIIGHEVGNGKIGFVADAADDGDAGTGDGSRHDLFVKGPEFFYRAAAACHDNDIGLAMLIQAVNGSDNSGRGLTSLHQCGGKDHLHERVTGAQDTQHIAQGRAIGGSDKANYGWLFGNGTLTLRLEQTFGGEASLQLLEAQEERAFADQLNAFDVELQFAVAFIEGDGAVGSNGHAVAQLWRGRTLAGELKKYAGQFRLCILQSEITVAGGIGAAAGDFALHPDIVQKVICLQQFFQIARKDRDA